MKPSLENFRFPILINVGQLPSVPEVLSPLGAFFLSIHAHELAPERVLSPDIGVILAQYGQKALYFS